MKRAWKKLQRRKGTDLEWALKNLKPITAARAIEINPHLNQALVDNGMIGFFYQCRYYNRDKKTCMAHESRPQMCRNYPEPNGTGATEKFWYTPSCGYRQAAETKKEAA